MKRWLLFLLLPAWMLISFASCSDDDGYSLNKFWVSFGTVDNPENNPVFYIDVDNGNRLWVGATPNYNYRPKTGQRILANYTILNDKPQGSGYDHDVVLNRAYNVLTKDIVPITPATQDSIGNDGIAIRDIWISGDHLNIEFGYWGNNKSHMLNLISDATKEYDDEMLHLEFRHNAYNDTPTFARAGIVSFNLSSIQKQPREGALDLLIHSTDIKGLEVIHKFTYVYGEVYDTAKEYDENTFAEFETADIE